MGVIHYVGCYDCGVYRDLGKFYTLSDRVETIDDAKEYALRIKDDAFRSGLLVSFLNKHLGHKCVVYTEDMSMDQVFDPDGNEENLDYDFWQEGEAIVNTV